MTLTRFRWMQPICGGCFEQRHPSLRPRNLADTSAPKTCCQCGVETRQGITVRVDPETVPHPTPESD